MDTGLLAALLAVLMGAVYLLVELKHKFSTPQRASRLSWLFTLELGAYLITLGALTVLLRENRISVGIYATVIWAFTLTLIPMSLYLMKKGVKGEPT